MCTRCPSPASQVMPLTGFPAAWVAACAPSDEAANENRASVRVRRMRSGWRSTQSSAWTSGSDRETARRGIERDAGLQHDEDRARGVHAGNRLIATVAEGYLRD